MVAGVGGHHQSLPAQAQVGRRGQLGPRLQGPQQVPEGGVHQQRPEPRPGDDEAELRADDGAGDGVLVAGEDGARCGHLALAHDGLAARVPVPEQHGAVLAAGHDVAVARVVALGAGEAGHHAVVAEHDLTDLGGLGAVHAEAVVPEAARDHEPGGWRHNQCHDNKHILPDPTDLLSTVATNVFDLIFIFCEKSSPRCRLACWWK